MNRGIGRLFAITTVLFTVLVISTSWWSVFSAEGLENNSANRRPLLRQEQIPRGLIVADEGTELAVSQNVATPQEPRYVREYPEGALFSHAVGYAFVSRGSAGLERFYNDDLGGEEEEFESIIDGFTTSTEEGEDCGRRSIPRRSAPRSRRSRARRDRSSRSSPTRARSRRW